MKRRNFIQLIAAAAMAVSTRVMCAEPPGVVDVPDPKWNYNDLMLYGIPIMVCDNLGKQLSTSLRDGRLTASGKPFLVVSEQMGDFLNGHAIFDLEEALWQ